MWASRNGYLDVVRTLLEADADVNAQTNVRNQMMIIIIIPLVNKNYNMMTVVNKNCDKFLMIIIILIMVI